jgi:predicted nucleic-acid-binding protein
LLEKARLQMDLQDVVRNAIKMYVKKRRSAALPVVKASDK